MAPPTNQSSSHHPLPPREQALFKRVVMSYEQKQYKAGLKFAKQILSNAKYSEHGETLSMKGLILNCMGRHEEAQDHVKRGLKSDIRSHVCWHVYGLLQRSEKKYDEAIKAYRNALRIDKDNMQILRDLSLLQIQMRDLEGYRDTRYQLLTLRPTQRASWIGYATAYHLLDDFDMALKIVDEFCKTQTPSDYDFEFSELLLYQNMILREAGKLELAFERLELNSSHIFDRLSYLETRASLLVDLNRLDEAERVYWQLLDRNPENINYYRRLEFCRRLGDKDDDIEARWQFYREIQERKPRAAMAKRIPLTFLRGAQFEDVLRPYLVTGLRKGVPSLFQNLVALYTDSEKTSIIEHQLLTMVKNLETNGYAKSSLDGSPEIESPTTVLWVYYFLAQHYDRLGQWTKAHMYVDRAIQHTPTLIELITTKAKIYKHSGNPEEASKWMEQAQQLDTADRYVNSKCAKYMLRAGQIAEAEMMCGKFTREGVNPVQNLNEMQCMWFETECARAYRRLNKAGEALKKCHEVDRHFTAIIEDQFDFHTYCVRKMTLCAYIGLLRLEDVLRRHRFYYRAAKIAIKIYLRLYDDPFDETNGDAGNENNLSSKEMRKQKRKAAKAAAKGDNTDKNKVPLQQQNAKEPDPELDGAVIEPLDADQLLKTQKPLDEAGKFVEPLIQLKSDQIGAYVLGFEVYCRKAKILLMLQCIRQGTSIDANHPKLHVCRIKFLLIYAKNVYDPAVREIVDETLPALFPTTTDPATVNKAFTETNINSLPHRLAAAEANILIDEKCGETMKNWVLKSLDDEKLKGRTWKTAMRIIHSIQNGRLGKTSPNEIENIARRCQKIFKETTLFAAFCGGVGDDVGMTTVAVDHNKENGHKEEDDDHHVAVCNSTDGDIIREEE